MYGAYWRAHVRLRPGELYLGSRSLQRQPQLLCFMMGVFWAVMPGTSGNIPVVVEYVLLLELIGQQEES